MHVLGGIRRDPSVDVSEAVKAADCREAPVNGRGRQPTLFHGSYVQLDLGAGSGEHLEAVVGCPLEEDTKVVAVCLERSGSVPGEESRGREVGFVDGYVAQVVVAGDGTSRGVDSGHGSLRM
ncbi:MAG TPA: hypothetical protein VM143_11225 [Acidimicrobiales bacterium]|nr:hypothetical protein [Acidimicrobiales bacterium]